MSVLQFNNDWKYWLEDESRAFYFQRLMKAIRKSDRLVYPEKDKWMRAFNETPLEKVKVVILGQDPYHDGRANGLAFSVNPESGIPPSLLNIYKELKWDLGYEIPNHGDLTKWTHEGVLLLNSILTVQKNKPMSHAGIGWEQFTDRILTILNKQPRQLVFILWGKAAQEKGKLIDKSKHHVLQSSHPSPFSANIKHGIYPAFVGSRPFSQANSFLVNKGYTPIDWSIPNKR